MKANRILFQLTLALAAAGFASVAAAAMYKWTDAEGNIQYSESPPDSGEVKEIAPPPKISAPPVTDSAKQADNGVASGEQENDKDVPLTPEEQDAYKRNCEAAKANLDIYKSSSRIKQSDGEVVEMNDDVRQKKIKQAEDQIKRYCK